MNREPREPAPGLQESTGHGNREPREPAPSAPRHGPRGRCRPRPHCTVILSAAEREGRATSRAAQRRVPRPTTHPPPVLTHGGPEAAAGPGGGRRGPAGGQEQGAAAAPEPSPPRRKWPPRLRSAACPLGRGLRPFLSTGAGLARAACSVTCACSGSAERGGKRRRPPCEARSPSQRGPAVRARRGHTPARRCECGNGHTRVPAMGAVMVFSPGEMRWVPPCPRTRPSSSDRAAFFDCFIQSDVTASTSAAADLRGRCVVCVRLGSLKPLLLHGFLAHLEHCH